MRSASVMGAPSTVARGAPGAAAGAGAAATGSFSLAFLSAAPAVTAERSSSTAAPVRLIFILFTLSFASGRRERQASKAHDALRVDVPLLVPAQLGPHRGRRAQERVERGRPAPLE